MATFTQSDYLLDWRKLITVTSYPEGQKLESLYDSSNRLLHVAGREITHRWSVANSKAGLALEWCDSEPPDTKTLLAALDALFTLHTSHKEVTIYIPGIVSVCENTMADWQQSGLLSPLPTGELHTSRELLWQQPRLWIPRATAPMPLQYTLSEGCRHPVRRPKPYGLVYQRFIPWLNKTFSLRTLDIERDLIRFNRWMNDPEVAKHWHEEGDLAQHCNYLQAIAANPHMYTLIGCLDGEPFSYFEIYWAKENRIGVHYDAQDHDRGWHVLIGEPAFRGKAFATVWLTSIAHYMFLDDPRTQRIVGEPNVNHSQQLRNLDLTGYARVKTFDFPHKRAQLVMLLREHYFANNLWWPRSQFLPAAATTKTDTETADSAYA